MQEVTEEYTTEVYTPTTEVEDQETTDTPVNVEDATSNVDVASELTNEKTAAFLAMAEEVHKALVEAMQQIEAAEPEFAQAA